MRKIILCMILLLLIMGISACSSRPIPLEESGGSLPDMLSLSGMFLGVNDILIL